MRGFSTPAGRQQARTRVMHYQAFNGKTHWRGRETKSCVNRAALLALATTRRITQARAFLERQGATHSEKLISDLYTLLNQI